MKRASGGMLHRLPARDDDGDWRVVVEAAAGSRNKYKYDTRRGVMVLHKVLPSGTAFPHDFGFVPSTRGEDGDPLDALVFADEPLVPGSVAPCRMIGILKASQRQDGETVRNDRLLAVSVESHRYGPWRGLADVPVTLLDELESFFVSYNAQRGIAFEPEARKGRRAARAAIAAGQKMFGKSK